MYVGINNWANETSRYILNENSLVENVFIEINTRSKNWFLSCSYNPNLTLLNNRNQNISRGLDFYSSKYNNFISLGDFNAETLNTTISEFCATYNLKNLIKDLLLSGQ